MDTEDWWDIVERARGAAGDRADDRDPPDDPLPDRLTEVLAARRPTEIVDFSVKAIEVAAAAYRWPLWKAAYLIEGGCGDDGFRDFRDGLILLGRETFTRAVADPDSLAELPVVVRMSGGSGWIGYESLSGPTAEAYRGITGETESLDTAVEAALAGRTDPVQPSGDDWDAEDDDEMRRRLPRLAALFLS
ncbi:MULTISPECIES: DUF4240 domain-containing protein [unclassified Streptomyces]|uniref:DUF4240 domain-containing protein n=1 Tax=unclassified Streptomyces TaxID=2593676 RepID=UPI00093B2C4F|nr:DUF4240 domain-containing protein [Streptomyces sp. TSRI0281]OKI40965.1 hypothetical protein A6A29_38380 [Streptomyces sp. TSRI0281]